MLYAVGYSIKSMTLIKYYKYSLNIYYWQGFQALKFNSEQTARKKQTVDLMKVFITVVFLALSLPVF